MVPRIEIAPGFGISRIVKGGWQLSQGHSSGRTTDPVADMFAHVRAGVTTFDCADIYTGVEELIGSFLKEYQRQGGRKDHVQVLTKFVPDYDALATLSKEYVTKVVDRSLQRLGVDVLDVVQFSWWSYSVDRYVEVAHWLNDLRVAGKIRLLAGTNFNTESTRRLIEAGIPLSTMQLQYSLLDNRPSLNMANLAVESNMKLLCYGTVAGGFLSERWLGQPEPEPPLETRSLIKYKLIVEDFGGWPLLQELLGVLNEIAKQHQVSIANVAVNYILNQPAVGACIIGARDASHLYANLKSFSFEPTETDINAIERVLRKRTGPTGDVFDLERDKEGRHGKIMRYNLNQIS